MKKRPPKDYEKPIDDLLEKAHAAAMAAGKPDVIEAVADCIIARKGRSKESDSKQ